MFHADDAQNEEHDTDGVPHVVDSRQREIGTLIVLIYQQGIHANRQRSTDCFRSQSVEMNNIFYGDESNWNKITTFLLFM